MVKNKEKLKQQSSLDFKIMSFGFKARDIFRPRINILKEADIKTGSRILDYGCGPGSYVAPVSKLIGDAGMLYAVDINPMAVKAVQRLAVKKKISNVKVILSGGDTALPPESIDTVLLYDILHDLENPAEVLTELQRVLKADGILSVSDHHLKKDDIISRITKEGLFKYKSKGKRTTSFSKDKR